MYGKNHLDKVSRVPIVFLFKRNIRRLKLFVKRAISPKLSLKNNTQNY